MDTNTEPNGSPPTPYPLPTELRLRRVRAVVNCLGDALEGDGDYSPHIALRADVCGLISDELQAIETDLERETL
jgi:hypothetical protein